MGSLKGFKVFRIRGGVHPDYRKNLSADQAIEDLPMPALLHIPLQQHVGAPAEALVQRGEMVQKGQMLARSQGAISAPVHAPTSGRIVGIGSYPAHHASGLSVRTVTLQPDGHDQWSDSLRPEADPFALSPDEIAARVAAAGIVGMGGAAFPSAVKLNLRNRFPLDTLIINGAECEPYLTCDDRLMRENSSELIEGVRLMAHALGVNRVLFGIENNKPEAIEAIENASSAYPEITVVGLPTRYPLGNSSHLIQALTGLETPARALSAEIGKVVHNVATALAVRDALRHGRPLISRIITVTGGAIRHPRNLRVPLGARVADLIDHCGGFVKEPARLISGGPMMGEPLPSLRVPIIKGNNGVLALSEEEVREQTEMPCIRCARCVEACPCGLVPLDMAANIRAGSLESSVKLGLLDCIACGSCSYVCPSRIPLVQYFNYAKGELATRQRARHKQGETKRLAEARTERLEAIQRAKREAMLKQKQQRETQKKRAAEASESVS
ncbi:MAG: electron transport complex subunit RsxC [Gammaproteobacteria bacterium]